MLTWIKLVRKFMQQLKSDLTPHQLGVGVFFGVLLGLTPPGLHWLAVFAAALLLNCSMAAMLLVAGALKPAGLLLGGAAFTLGFNLLEGGSWYSHVIAGLSGAPVLAFLGFERYVVAGAYAIAFPAGTLLALLTRIGVTAYRKVYAKKLEDAAWYQKVTSKALPRFFVTLLLGKPKDFVERKPRFILLRPFRPYMVAFVPLLAIGLTVGGGLYAQMAIGGLAAGAASRALGVQVTFGKIDYSFFGQALALERFQLPDPNAPTENLLQVAKLEADWGFLELLRGRVHVEKLSASGVATRVARESDGTLNVSKLPAAQPKADAPAGEQAAWQEYLQWATTKSKEQDWNELFRKYQEYRAKSAKAREEEAKKPAAPKVVPAYDGKLAWAVPRAEPLVRVDLFEIKDVRLDVDERGGGAAVPSLTGFEIKGEQLSMKPGWNGKPLTLVAVGKLAEGKSGSMKVELRIESGVEGRIEFEEAPLADWKGLYEKSLPVAVEKGVLGMGVSGKTASGALDVKAGLKVESLKVAAKPGETRILGLDPEMSGYAIQGLNAYGEKLPLAFGATVTGRLDAPVLTCEVGLLEAAKKGLEMLGRKELDAVIAKFGARVDDVKKAGEARLAPAVDNAKKVQEAATKALETGDTKAVQEALQKTGTDLKTTVPAAKEDVKKVQEDAKKDVKAAKESIEGLKGLFKKKKEEPK